MTRGYPRSMSRIGAGLTRAATRASARARSGTLAAPPIGGLLGHIPGPPRGAIPAAALLLGAGLVIGLVSDYFSDGMETGMPVFRPGFLYVKPGLTYWGTRRTPNVGGSALQTMDWDGPNMAVLMEGWLHDGGSGGGSWPTTPPATTAFIPSGRNSTFSMADPLPPSWMYFPAGLNNFSVAPGNWYHVTREIRREAYSLGPPLWRYKDMGRVDIWYNNSGATVTEPVQEAPPVWMPPVAAPRRWPTFYVRGGRRAAPPLIGSTDGPTDMGDFVGPGAGGVPGTAPPPAHTVPGIRGWGMTTTGEVTSPMGPPRTEMKTEATELVMQLISRTIGRTGEGIDVVRCIMFATGNTYRSRGVEKAIPKWRWAEAVASLIGAGPYQIGQRTVSTVRGTNILTPDGRLLSPQQVAARLIRCLVSNEIEDRVIGAISHQLAQAGGDMFLTAGPFGIESILAAANGDMPYSGAFDLGLR